MAIKLGSTTINGLYLGSTAINKAYLGATEVFTTSAEFDPASLFANGEEGVWLDPSDLSTMWTDTAGTTQATVGDEVARIDDKSGNGNHATQATFAARPILRQTGGGLYYLEFDGTDDHLDFSGAWSSSAAFYLSFAGSTITTTANAGFILLNTTATNNTQRQLGISGSAIKVDVRGVSVELAATLSDEGVFEAQFDAPTSGTISAGLNGGAFSDRTSANIQPLVSNASVIGVGLTGREVDAKMFASLVLARQPTDQERSDWVSYAAAKSGVTL